MRRIMAVFRHTHGLNGKQLKCVYYSGNHPKGQMPQTFLIGPNCYSCADITSLKPVPNCTRSQLVTDRVGDRSLGQNGSSFGLAG